MAGLPKVGGDRGGSPPTNRNFAMSPPMSPPIKILKITIENNAHCLGEQ